MYNRVMSLPKHNSVFVDISNGSVAAALGVHDAKNHFRVDYVTRKSIHLDPEAPKGALLQSVILGLSEVLKDTASHASKGLFERKHHINEVFIGVSSPWYISKTFDIEVVRKEPFVVTKKFIEETLANEINRFVKEVHEGVYKGLIEGELMIHEQNVVSTALNGYKTTNPYGKETSSLSMCVYVSLFAKDFIQKVTHALESHIVFKNLSFHSFPFLCGTAITKLFSNDTTAFIVDLTEHTTDITYMKNGVLESTATIPLGATDITDRVSKALNVQPHIGSSMLRAFSESILGSQATIKVSSAVSLSKDEWLAFIMKVGKDLVDKNAFPVKVFFTAPADMSVLCENFLKEHFTSISLDNEKTSSFVNHSPFVGKDAPISLIALGALM